MLKRSIHKPALAALILVCFAAAGAIRWLWQNSLLSPGDIHCNHGKHVVFACGTDFGNYATVVAVVAVPLIVWLAHKAFFTRFKRVD